MILLAFLYDDDTFWVILELVPVTEKLIVLYVQLKQSIIKIYDGAEKLITIITKALERQNG